MSNGSTKKRMNIHTIAKISILSALATILMLLNFHSQLLPHSTKWISVRLWFLIGGFAIGYLGSGMYRRLKGLTKSYS